MNKEIKHILFGLLISLTLISGAFVFTIENQFAIVPNEKGVFPTSLSKIAKNFTPIKEAEAILQCDTGCVYNAQTKNCECDALDGGFCDYGYVDGECGDPLVNDYCNYGIMTGYRTNANYALWSCTSNPAGCGFTASCSIPLARAGVCGSTQYSCSVGTVANTIGSNGNYSWQCVGTNGGSTASCSISLPIAGVCSGTTFACDAGTPQITTNSFCQSGWNCVGLNGGGTATCPTYTRARGVGVCGSSINSCDNTNATMTDQTDSYENNLWNCSGTCGGPSADCSYPKTNGACGSSLWSCNAGVISAQSSDTNYNYWRCLGQFNGADSGTCTYPTTNGVCGGSTYSCSSGSPVNQSNNGTYYTWNCNGANNGSNSGQCTYHMPEDGSCSGSHFNCNSGDPVNANTSASWWTWNCAGRYGGATSGQCTEPIPVPGVCHPTSDNTCLQGAWVNSTTDGNYNYWYCNGFYGGATSPQCTYLLTPTVYSVTPHTAYGGTTGNGYAGEGATLTWAATSYPTACNIYKNGSYYTQVGGSVTSFATEGLAAGDTTWGVACGNATGWSGVSNVTFRSVAPIPSQSGSCPNPGSVASFSWTLPSRAIGVYFRVDDNTTNPGTYSDNIDGTSRTLSSIAGHAYTWWVHARDAYGNWSAPTYGNYSCALNGVCNNGAINGCNAGNFSDLGDDGNYNYWQCLGIGGGGNSGTCSYAKVNGACSGTTYQCSAGSPVNNSSNGTQYTWNCNGSANGSNASCANYIPVNASCGGSNNTCNSGDLNDIADDSNYNNWQCIGRYGGSSTGCSTAKVNGSCNNGSINACGAGSFSDLGDDGNYNYWQCLGSNNGTNSGTCSYAKVNGACGGSVNACNAGGLSDTADDSVNYNWQCTGSANGTTAGCTYPKPPVVSLSSATAYGGGGSTAAYEGESVTLSWTASNSPSSCTIYRNGSLLTGVSGGTTSYGTPAVSAGNTTFTVYCSNGGGTGTSNTITVNVPDPLTNVTATCPAPGTTAYFSWTLPSGTVGSYFRLYSDDLSAQVCVSLSPPVGDCSSPGGSSYTMATTPNKTYAGWIHSRGPAGNHSYAVGIPSVFCTPNVPAVSVSMNTGNGGSSGSAYAGESGTLNWTATNNPTSCSIYQNGSLLTTTSGGTTSYGTPGLGEGNTTYRVDCSNAGGTGTGNTVTFKVPTAPSNMSVSCPAPGTTANFSWTLPSGISNTYFRYYKTPPASIDYTTACTLGHNPPEGSCIDVAGSSVSQATNYNTNYYWYIHSKDAYNNWSAAYGGGFYCTPPNPAAPSISGTTLGSVNGSYTYNFSGTDPAGMQVKYQIDWNYDGSPDVTTSLGNSGWTHSPSYSWTTAGSKTFEARTVASDGRTSGWSTYTVTINNIPVVAINPASSVITYNTAGNITWSSSYAVGCNITKAGSAWQSGTAGNSVSTGALTSDTIFDIYCSNGVDTTHSATTIYLRPEIGFSQNPSTIPYNTATTLYWGANYAASCGVTKGGAAWMTGTDHNAGVSSGNLLSTTVFNLICTASNGNTNSQSLTTTVSPLNGACSATVNTCNSGTYSDIADTAAAQLWNCTGANGGTTSNCTILKPPVAPTITGPTDGAKDTNYNFNITGTDNAGYQVKYGLDWDNDGIQDGATVLGASGWSYVWTNNWGGGGAKYFKAKTITSDGRESGWSSVYTMNIHDIPTVSISAAATVLNVPPGSTNITWSSGDSTDCSVTKNGSAWLVTAGTSGTNSSGAIALDTTFTLTCNGSGGTNSTSVVVYRNPSVSITASPTSIAYNAATTISWGSTYAASCNITKDGSAWQTGLSNAGVTSGLLTANSTFQIDCASASGHSKSASTVVTVAPLNGLCNAAHYVCNAGTSANNISGAMKWTWDCNGANGGTNATCEETKPDPSVPVITGSTTGKINTNYTFGFTATNPSGDPIRYAIDWDNNGTIDGYLPVSGTTAEGTTLNWTNQWAGSGTKIFKVRTETNGGPVSEWVSHSILLYGAPVITWSPASTNVVYHGKLDFGYTATDATYCNLYSTTVDDWNTYEAIPYISGGAISDSWTGAGPYDKNFKRKAICYNPFGEYSSAEISVTVLQNAATCGTITAPEYLLPSQTFNPVITMNNTGTNPWTTGSLVHAVTTSVTDWNFDFIEVSNPTVNPGQVGTFTASLTAPATEGLYDFTWRASEYGRSWSSIFGPLCSITTSNGNKIVVKEPTLGVGDTDTDVELLAFPTNYVADDPAVTRTLTIRNRGGGNVTGNVTIPAGLFSCVSGCSFNIGPGGTSVATISFQSSATGTFGEYATITSDAGTKTVNLTGKTGDKFTVLTSPLGFGQVATSRSKYLTLSITNNSVVQTSSAFAISPTAPFYCVSGCANATIAPLTTRSVRIYFNPTVINASPITQNLVLPTTPSITISLVGQGVKPILKVEER